MRTELTNSRDVLGVAVHLLVAQIVVLVVDDDLAAHHLPASSPPSQPPAPAPPRGPASDLWLGSPPGGDRHGDAHAVRGEQVAALGPNRDVLGVEVANTGQVHQGVITCKWWQVRPGVNISYVSWRIKT